MSSSRPTAQDVAQRAGVSQSTVSYVLNGKRTISEATRERVLRAATTLGYHVNSGAKRLREGRSRVITLLVPDLAVTGRSALMTFIAHIAQAAYQRGYDVVLVTADEGADGLRRIAKGGGCDGIILMELDLDDSRLEAIREIDMPVVCIGQPTELGMLSVDLDFAQVAARALRRFSELGHRRVSVVAPISSRRRRQYMRAFLDGCRHHAPLLGVDLRVVDGGDEHHIGSVLPPDHLIGGRASTGFLALTASVSLFTDLARHGHLDDAGTSVILVARDLSIDPLGCRVELIDPMRQQICELAVSTLLGSIEGELHVCSQQLLSPQPGW